MLALYRSGRRGRGARDVQALGGRSAMNSGSSPAPVCKSWSERSSATIRRSSRLQPIAMREEESSEKVRRRRFPTRSTRALAIALIPWLLPPCLHWLRPPRDSSGGSHVPVELMGESVAVDPGTDTIVGEIPVGGRPSGPAVGEGSVWVGNRDDNTLLRIDPRSLDVHTIGLSVAPIDVEVTARWILSDRALLRVDPASMTWSTRSSREIGSGRWSDMEVGAKTVFVCNCHGGPGSVIRIDSRYHVRGIGTPKCRGDIAYGEGALWALTGEDDRTDRPKDERSHGDHSARTNRRDQWLALSHDNSRRCDLGAGCRVTMEDRFHDQAPRWKRSAGAQRGRQQRPGRRRSCLGRDLRGPCFMSTRTPRRWPSRFRSGLSSTPPTYGTHSRLVRDRSGLRSRRSLRDDPLPAAPRLRRVRTEPHGFSPARRCCCSRRAANTWSEPEGRDARHDPRSSSTKLQLPRPGGKAGI